MFLRFAFFLLVTMMICVKCITRINSSIQLYCASKSVFKKSCRIISWIFLLSLMDRMPIFFMFQFWWTIEITDLPRKTKREVKFKRIWQFDTHSLRTCKNQIEDKKWKNSPEPIRIGRVYKMFLVLNFLACEQYKMVKYLFSILVLFLGKHSAIRLTFSEETYRGQELECIFEMRVWLVCGWFFFVSFMLICRKVDILLTDFGWWTHTHTCKQCMGSFHLESLGWFSKFHHFSEIYDIPLRLVMLSLLVRSYTLRRTSLKHMTNQKKSKRKQYRHLIRKKIKKQSIESATKYLNTTYKILSKFVLVYAQMREFKSRNAKRII